MATLEQFLRTGELGPVRTGMTMSEAVACLGAPQDQSVGGRATILKYGALQLTFAYPRTGGEARLALIAIYFRQPIEPIPAPMHLTDFDAAAETTIAGFRSFLDRAGIKEHSSVDGHETSYLIMPSGARVTFDDKRLDCITLAARVPAAPTKQISVAISEEAWKQLNALARQSNRSVSDLCAQWITQRAQDQRG